MRAAFLFLANPPERRTVAPFSADHDRLWYARYAAFMPMDLSDDGFDGHRPQQVRAVIDAGAGHAPLVPIEIKK